MEKNTIVQRIPNYYIGDNCVQVKIPYWDNLTIMDDSGILFHSFQNLIDSYVNKYLGDERANAFPYKNIPSYNYKKITYVNQLFDFNRFYLVVGTNYGVATEEYVIKDGDSALFIKNRLNPRDSLSLRKRVDVIDIFNKTNVDEKIYYLASNGSVISDLDMLLPCEDILDGMRTDYIYSLNNGKPILIVRINGNDINIKAYMIDYIKSDCYRVNETELPLTKYNLNMINLLGYKIKKYSEPRISLRNNPNIRKSDIKEAKDRIKELKLSK